MLKSEEYGVKEWRVFVNGAKCWKRVDSWSNKVGKRLQKCCSKRCNALEKQKFWNAMKILRGKRYSERLWKVVENE